MITENDKLIAEFMGYTFSDDKRIDNTESWADTMRGMQYDTSWDCIMPAISQCLEAGGDIAVENIYHSLHTQDLSFAHESVMQFIKEYNNTRG